MSSPGPNTVFHIRLQQPTAHLPTLRNPRIAYTTNSPAWSAGIGIGNGSERYNALYENEFAKLHKLFNAKSKNEHPRILNNSELRWQAEERFDYLCEKIPTVVTLNNVRYGEIGEIKSHWKGHELEKRREDVRKLAEEDGKEKGENIDVVEEEMWEEVRKVMRMEQHMALQVNVASLLVDLYNDKYYNAVNEGKPLEITAQKDIEGKGRVNVLEVRIVGRLRKLLEGHRGERIRKIRAKVESLWNLEKATKGGLFAKLDTDMRLIWNWELTKGQQPTRKLHLKSLARQCGEQRSFREDQKRNMVMKVLKYEMRNKGQVEMGEDMLSGKTGRKFERMRREMKVDEDMSKRKEEKRKRREEEKRDQGQGRVIRRKVFWPLGTAAYAYPVPRP